MLPLGLTACRVAKDIRVPLGRIDAIMAGKRAITSDIALRLGAYFGTGPEVWVHLQARFDLMQAKRSGMPDIPLCKALAP